MAGLESSDEQAEVRKDRGEEADYRDQGSVRRLSW